MLVNSLGKYSEMDDNSKLGAGTIVGNFSSIVNSLIGKNSSIGSHCIIGHPPKKTTTGKDITHNSPRVKDFLLNEKTVIGDNSIIRSHSVIYSHVKAGNNFTTGHRVLIREHTRIGNSVTIGSGAIIDGYAQIGDRSQIQSNCYIAQSVSIGKYVFIAPCTSFYDNKKMILDVKEDLLGAKIEDYVRMGGGCIILPGINIGKFAMIGAGSVVTKDAPERHLAYGNPARVMRKLSDAEINQYVNSVDAKG